jgi:hypothetical protein
LKILLHICCAPCAIYPVKTLRLKGMDVMGFFYRNNIHPYTECLKRQETLQDYAGSINLNVIYQEGYDLEGVIKNVVFRESFHFIIWISAQDGKKELKNQNVLACIDSSIADVYTAKRKDIIGIGSQGHLP